MLGGMAAGRPLFIGRTVKIDLPSRNLVLFRDQSLRPVTPTHEAAQLIWDWPYEGTITMPASGPLEK